MENFTMVEKPDFVVQRFQPSTKPLQQLLNWYHLSANAALTARNTLMGLSAPEVLDETNLAP
jgi:hypothetical protein